MTPAAAAQQRRGELPPRLRRERPPPAASPPSRPPCHRKGARREPPPAVSGRASPRTARPRQRPRCRHADSPTAATAASPPASCGLVHSVAPLASRSLVYGSVPADAPRPGPRQRPRAAVTQPHLRRPHLWRPRTSSGRPAAVPRPRPRQDSPTRQCPPPPSRGLSTTVSSPPSCSLVHSGAPPSVPQPRPRQRSRRRLVASSTAASPPRSGGLSPRHRYGRPPATASPWRASRRRPLGDLLPRRCHRRRPPAATQPWPLFAQSRAVFSTDRNGCKPGKRIFFDVDPPPAADPTQEVKSEDNPHTRLKLFDRFFSQSDQHRKACDLPKPEDNSRRGQSPHAFFSRGRTSTEKHTICRRAHDMAPHISILALSGRRKLFRAMPRSKRSHRALPKHAIDLLRDTPRERGFWLPFYGAMFI